MKKRVAFVVLCFLIFTTAAFAELTQTDLEKIQSIVEKSVEKSEKRIKEYVDLKINALDGKLSGEIKGIDGRLTQIYGFVIALVALIAIAVGIPHILVARQGKEIRT